jgi:hypothetical protein
MASGKPLSFITRFIVAVEACTRGSVCPGTVTLAGKRVLAYMHFASASLCLRILRQSAFVFGFFILNSQTSALDYNTFIRRDTSTAGSTAGGTDFEMVLTFRVADPSWA